MPAPARGARPATQLGPHGSPPGFATTARLGASPPATGTPGRAPATQAFGSPVPQPPPGVNDAFGSQPPARPPPLPVTFGSAPPVQQLPQQPPPFSGFGAPVQPFGSAPPPPAAPPMASQPPVFGAFPSNPPAAEPPAPLGMGLQGPPPLEQDVFNPRTAPIPGTPNAPQHLAFAAPVLVDVSPRALVVETAGGYTDTIIPRNSKIPCERTRRFATGRDMQTTVRVRVAQGEHQFFPHNTYLGEVELSGLRPAPRGEVVVAVTFEVDADGTLRVRARDVQTGQEARATLQLVGVADESSVVMMINRFAQQPVVGGGPPGGVS
jgi:molecular chaperone DnaK